MYRLLLKTHNKTGMKYLCVTCKENYEKYRGSGVYWLKHLKKHGYDISTTIIHESKHRDQDFIDFCIETSKRLNVVESEEFANLMHECANSSIHGKSTPEEIRQKMSLSQRKIWNSDGVEEDLPRTIELKKKVSESSSKFWSSEEGNKLRVRHHDRMKNMNEDVRKKLSEMMIMRWEDMSDDERKQHGNKITEGRLAMSEDAKRRRSEKVLESFKTSEARKEFEERIKIERLGGGNPASKSVHWDGLIFASCKEFYAFCKEKGITKAFARKCIESEDYPDRYEVAKSKTPSPKPTEIGTCPHCKKEAILSCGFKRWHFDNCKQKKEKQ